MNLVPLRGDVIRGIDNRFVPSTLSSTDIRCFQSSRSLYPFSRSQTEIFIMDGCYQISFNVGEGVSSWFCFSITRRQLPSTKVRIKKKKTNTETTTEIVDHILEEHFGLTPHQWQISTGAPQVIPHSASLPIWVSSLRHSISCLSFLRAGVASA